MLSPVWSVEHTTRCTASPKAVWDVWADVGGWARWNPTLKEVSFDGPLAEGTTGRLKPASGPRSKVVLCEVRPTAGFVVASGLPGARMRVEHEVGASPEGGSQVTERAVLEGPLSRLWSLLLGGQLRRDMPSGTQATAREAAARSGPTPASDG